MSAKRQSGPRKWGNLLVTRETFEFLNHLYRAPISQVKARTKGSSRAMTGSKNVALKSVNKVFGKPRRVRVGKWLKRRSRF